MNKQIRKVGYTLLILFAALFVNLNYIQLVRAERLANHPSNTRLLLKEYAIARGAILSADNQTLVQSRPTPESALKYLRTYEQGPAFAHVTGYYSVRYGREGLERTHNTELTGKRGVITMQDLGDRLLGEGEHGDDIRISIDTRVQAAAVDALQGRSGAIVAVDPSSGQVLAMASTPTFDPNQLSQHSAQVQQEAWERLSADPSKPLLNRSTSATYAPGSTFKLLAVAAALQNGRGVDTAYPAMREYTPPQTDRSIGNFGGGTCGGGMVEALVVSCNTYFAQLGAELPRGSLEEAAKAFGFGERPPLDLRAVASRMPSAESLRSPAFAAQTAIGQFDVAATPLQMALVAAGIGNGGKVPAPSLVMEVRDARGSVVRTRQGDVWKEALSEANAATLRDMMVQVVERGTGRAAALSGVEVAGKTGTAQAGANNELGLAWFVAFAPANTPRIAVAVVVEAGGEGRSETGGRLAAPLAKQVMEAHRSAAGW